MDQMKIGKFIKQCRKEKNLTQQELADKLKLSYKTVSKWECGNGIPDVSIMLPLCNELEISVNELLSGCHIAEKDYVQKAEENLLNNAMKERTRNKRIIISETILVITTIIQCLIIILLVGLLELKDYLRIILIVTTIITLFASIFALCYIENDAGYFE